MNASTGNVGRIFVSYRREETAYPAGWLFDRLASHFGRGQVFKDVDSIELGDDFVEVITTAVGSCDVLLALIGDRWLTITDQDGRRRLDNPDDFVRLEIETALTRNVRVIPILVEGARMPRVDELPASLAKLVRRQALELSPSRFDFDTGRLLRVLERTITEAQEQARQEAERAAAHRRQIEQLQDQIRERAAAQDWDTVLAINDQLTALDPAAADPDALASSAREQITRRQEAEDAAAQHRRQPGRQASSEAEIGPSMARSEDAQGRTDEERAAKAPNSVMRASTAPVNQARSRGSQRQAAVRTAKPRAVSPGTMGLSMLRSKRTKPRPVIQYSLLGFVGFFLFSFSLGPAIGSFGRVHTSGNIGLRVLFIGLATVGFALAFVMFVRGFFAGRVISHSPYWSYATGKAEWRFWSPSERERRLRRLFWLLPPPWLDAEPPAEPPSGP
jgi:hypothetical protein